MGARQIPLVVLLVTPLHIELLNHDVSLIPEIVCKAFSTCDVGQEFHVIAAVVDRVPHTQSEPSEPYITTKVVKNDGLEGISVCILDSETAAPDLWTTQAQPNARKAMSVQQQSTLSFILQPTPQFVEALINQTPPQSVTSRSVQLPVANTLFRNGRTSTLLAQRWIVASNQEPRPELRLAEEIDLPQQSLHMSGIVGSKAYYHRYSLNPQLTLITPPRIIAAGMGNIIRTIQFGDNFEKTMPASTELESAVARIRQTRKIDGIWAQVTPGENHVRHPRARLDYPLQKSIDYGSRLHKVLSGGGGWGNKQGLLALDPDSDYGKNSEASLIHSGDGEDFEAEKSDILGEVVKPGDVISFWAHIPRETKKINTSIIASPKSLTVIVPRSVIFGVIPSTMDLAPESEVTSAKGTTASQYTLIVNQFGMLSEHGMSMKVSTIGPESQSALGVEQVGLVVQTKLDVPYTRIKIADAEERKTEAVRERGYKSLHKHKARGNGRLHTM